MAAHGDPGELLRAAHRALLAADLHGAVDLARRALAHGHVPPDVRVDAILVEGDALLRYGDAARALAAFTGAEQWARALPVSLLIRAKAEARVAFVAARLGPLAESERAYRAALETLSRAEESPSVHLEMARAANGLAWVREQIDEASAKEAAGLRERARHHADRVIEMAGHAPQPDWVAIGSAYSARAYARKYQSTYGAIEDASRAAAALRRVPSPDALAQAAELDRAQSAWLEELETKELELPPSCAFCDRAIEDASVVFPGAPDARGLRSLVCAGCVREAAAASPPPASGTLEPCSFCVTAVPAIAMRARVRAICTGCAGAFDIALRGSAPSQPAPMNPDHRCVRCGCEKADAEALIAGCYVSTCTRCITELVLEVDRLAPRDHERVRSGSRRSEPGKRCVLCGSFEARAFVAISRGLFGCDACLDEAEARTLEFREAPAPPTTAGGALLEGEGTKEILARALEALVAEGDDALRGQLALLQLERGAIPEAKRQLEGAAACRDVHLARARIARSEALFGADRDAATVERAWKTALRELSALEALGAIDRDIAHLLVELLLEWFLREADPRRARALVLIALGISGRHVGACEPYLFARAMRLLGDAHYRADASLAAQAAYRRSLDLLSRQRVTSASELQRGACYLGLGHTAKDDAEALEHYAAAREIYVRHRDEHRGAVTDLATTWQSVASTFDRKGEPIEAAEAFVHAAETLEAGADRFDVDAFGSQATDRRMDAARTLERACRWEAALGALRDLLPNLDEGHQHWKDATALRRRALRSTHGEGFFCDFCDRAPSALHVLVRGPAASICLDCIEGLHEARRDIVTDDDGMERVPHELSRTCSFCKKRFGRAFVAGLGGAVCDACILELAVKAAQAKAARAGTSTDPAFIDVHAEGVSCSFCDKSQHEVKKIISAPAAWICDECINLCNDIFAEKCPTGDEERRRLPEKETNRTCSFCDRSVVRIMVSGSPKVAICDSCIDLCNEIIAEEVAKESTGSA